MAGGRVGHDDDAAHNGMNAALIRVSARRQAGNGIGATGFHRAGVEGATSAFVKTAVASR